MSQQLTKRQQYIIRTYYRIEDTEPDISTERLFQMVIDETHADAEEIAEALTAGVASIKEK